MSPSELRQKLVSVTNEVLVDVPNFPGYAHSTWKDVGNGARMCVVYTYIEKPVATPIILFPSNNEQEAFKQAVERIQHGLTEQ